MPQTPTATMRTSDFAGVRLLELELTRVSSRPGSCMTAARVLAASTSRR